MSFLLNRKAAGLVSSSKNEFLTDRSRVAVELNETVKEKHVETDTELFAQALHKDSSKMAFENSSKRHDSRQHDMPGRSGRLLTAMTQSSDFEAIPLPATKQSASATEGMKLDCKVKRSWTYILQPEEGGSSKKPKFGDLQLTAAKQARSTAEFQQCEFEQFTEVFMDNVITFSRCEAKPFVSTESQTQQMLVNGLIFMTVVSLSFQRCYKANDHEVKLTEPNGKGPRIAIQVFLALVEKPDIRTPENWRNLNLVFQIHDNGVRFDIEELYFSAKGGIDRGLDEDWGYIASILQGTIKYLSTLYDCPGYEKPTMIFWELTTKSHPLEECFLVMQQCAHNKRMKKYVREVLNQSQGASLYGYIC